MDELDTLQSLLPRLAAYQERPAVLTFTKEQTERWTYSKIAEQASRLATGLSQHGSVKGDHVALWAENSPQWIAACLGVIASGAIAVPLDVQLADDALGHALRDSEARYIFTSMRLLERLRRVAVRSGCEPILLGEGAAGIRGWQDLGSDPANLAAMVAPEDRAVLFYTSGTTGPPKGVPLTHRNLAFQLNSLLAAGLVTDDDRVLLPLPLHHVYPFTIGMLTPLAKGLPLVLPHTLTGPQLIRALREGAVTAIIGVPRLYDALFAGIQSRAERGHLSRLFFRRTLALSTALAHLKVRVGRRLFRRLHREMGPQLRVLASGGAALNPDLAWKLEGLGWLVGTGYGLTETSPLLTMDKPGHARIGSVGRPIPGVEIRIDQVEVGDGIKVANRPSRRSEEGEVVARGPSVFGGYHNLPEETKQAFTSDGWFRTGDLGHLDRDGFLYLTGRVKTLIVLPGGEKVQPDDVEEAYQESPAIREAGVLEREGKLVAVILPKHAAAAGKEGSEQAAEEAIREALAERSKAVPSYQRIAEFVLAKSPLPRTRLGKIRREELGKFYKETKEGRVEQAPAGPMPEDEMTPDDRALLDDPGARETWQWLAERFSEHRLTPDTSLQLDLGIDSLEWLDLTMEIRRRCGVELDEEAIGRIETVRDLLREVAEQPQAGKAGRSAAPLENPEQTLGEEMLSWLAPLGPAERVAARCLYALNWTTIHTAFRLNVRGRERLPGEGPFVLAPNHTSYLDSFVLCAALDYHLISRSYWAGWTGVAFGPVTHFLSRLAHVVPIDPAKGAASSLAFGAAVLRRKHILVWYPEGERSRTGELEPLKPGIGLILEHDPVPVIPVNLDGTHDAWPAGRRLPRPARIRITFGQPLDPRELERKGKGDLPSERITSALHNRMARLVGTGETS